MDLEHHAFSLQECVNGVLDLLRSRAKAKGLELAYTFHEGAPAIVVGDDTRLRQVLVNLVGNAIKFTARGVVSLSVAVLPPQQSPVQEGYVISFTVQDTGIGIPPDRLQHLFQPFSQGDASTTRHYGGTGLGLAISKRLVELMGGRIWAESRGVPGAGSAFRFTVTTRLPTGEEYAAWLDEQNVPEAPADRLDPSLGREHPLRILLAEDNAINQKLIRRLLGRLGYRIDVAANGYEALDALRRQPYDVVLMDIQMPELDGLEAARVIVRDWPAEGRPHLVALTANAVRRDRDAYLAAGMDDYLSKPIRVGELVRVLKTCCPQGATPTSSTRPAAAPRMRPRQEMARSENHAADVPVTPGVATAAGQQADNASAPRPAVLAPALALAGKALAGLRRIGAGDPTLVDELVEAYLEDSPAMLTQMQRALQEDDAQTLWRVSHNLKSNSAEMGAEMLAELCQRIERLARGVPKTKCPSRPRAGKSRVCRCWQRRLPSSTGRAPHWLPGRDRRTADHG